LEARGPFTFKRKDQKGLSLMAVTNPQAPKKGVVTVSDWNACFNSGENIIALSCSITSVDASPSITGVGIILNDIQGATLATCYTNLSGGVETVSPALNLLPGHLGVGDAVSAVAQGEYEGQHFFYEQHLTIGKC
jgi:hypothetical protein